MVTSSRLNQRGKLIPLSPSFLSLHGREQTEHILRSILKSVKYELVEKENAFYLCGPETSYHCVDRYLAKALGQCGESLSQADIASYKCSKKSFDLCFEDCWSGFFIADYLRDLGKNQDLVILHLDDHADMMPTLLERSGEGLTNPATGFSFDPSKRGDWESAIEFGTVSIGNFITPLYYSGHNIHVRHLANSIARSHELRNVVRDSRCYELIPNRQFAAIRTVESDMGEGAGTCLTTTIADEALEDIPVGRILVHIDLDYFVYDFDGSTRPEDYTPDPVLMVDARLKMDRFFASLRRFMPRVDRWFIATSPGFCSAYHWNDLLAELEKRIKQFEEP